MALRLVVLSSTGYVTYERHTRVLLMPWTIRTAILHAEADLGGYRLRLCTMPVNGSRRSGLRFLHAILMNHVRH